MGAGRRTGRRSYLTYDTAPNHDAAPISSTSAPLDLADVKGQEVAKRALEVAVAGDHSLLLVGPRSSSKTLLGRCIPSILPPPTKEEAEEIAEVYRRARLDPPPGRPFRAPHFSTRPTDLVGRGRKPGEVDLARGGVLFLDDLPAFGKRSLRAIRPLLEEGAPGEPNTSTADSARSRFMLVAAMRSCPCGHRRARQEHFVHKLKAGGHHRSAGGIEPEVPQASRVEERRVREREHRE